MSFVFVLDASARVVLRNEARVEAIESKWDQNNSYQLTDLSSKLPALPLFGAA